MNKILIFFVVFISSYTTAADWVFATKTKQENFYVDRTYYKYQKKDGLAEIWWKSEKRIDEPYTTSKALIQYDCLRKKSRYQAYVDYNYDGSVKSEPKYLDKTFGIVYPDTVDEELWKIACNTKGNGLDLKYQLSETERAKKIVDAYNSKNNGVVTLSNKIAEKYYNKELNSTQIDDLESDINNGLVKLPY
ncbi:surface-adhesin E family protein [Acinetobacter sp. ABJ_C1_1]|uniref:surface-adhesin E family protein n=1 Tax=Acinetobacter sp. ABJ_C1_1 TaxID=3378321 RepID=UPI0037DC9E09